MSLNELLQTRSSVIIGNAIEAIERAHLRHYEADGIEETRARLVSLFDLTTRALRRRNAAPLIRYAENVARQRFFSGFGLAEVQTAFNVLEEAMWKEVLRGMEPGQLAEALGFVSTVLGMGKDALARAYVSLASRTRVPTLILRTLFDGVEGSRVAE